ncbi:MAG: glycosyltransferase family 9 protein [Bacteroidales bacterium]|nr:glycosyltransferase family 9 protein [Bacteroidales bacterium]
MNKFLIYILLFYYHLEFLLSRLVHFNKEDSICILKIDAIGDMVIWLDVAEEIRRVYNDKKIVLICNNACLPLVKHLPFFDEIIGIDKHKFLFNIVYRTKFIKQIVNREFEKVINPVFARDYFSQDILVRLLRAKEKIGSQGQYLNTESILTKIIRNETKRKKQSNKLKQEADKYYTKLATVNPLIIMEKTRNADFCRQFISESFLSNIPQIPFKLVSLNSFCNLMSKEYIVLFTGAGTQRRFWPIKNYVDLLKNLKGNTIVLSGGKGEDKMWKDIDSENSYDYMKNVYNLIGKTSMIELFSLIANAKYIITTDTSASHITVITRTPSICLLGGNDKNRFQPYELEKISEEDKKILPKVVNYKMDCYGCNAICKYIKDKETTWPCIENITVEQVLEKIKEIK